MFKLKMTIRSALSRTIILKYIMVAINKSELEVIKRGRKNGEVVPDRLST